MRCLGPLALVCLTLAACSSAPTTSMTGGSGGGGAPPTPPTGPLVWEALPSAGAPSARYLHTAVWTGDKMVVWGGFVNGTVSVTGTGAAYDPATKTWTPTSSTGAPEARHSHTAVWTGSKMIVWGGYGTTSLAEAGAIYDPASDTWTPMSTAGQPSPRTLHTAVWTGSTMIVWGGMISGTALADGGIYDPAKDAWVATTQNGAAAPRYAHGATWTGTQMLVWGGNDSFGWRGDGAFFDPSKGPGGTWVSTTPSTGAPQAREQVTTVWTSKDLLLWGGWNGGPYLQTGGLLPTGGSWTPTTLTGAPSPRAENVGLWTEGELVVWGGCGGDICSDVVGDGGRFVPDEKGGTWTPITAQAALTPRRGAAGVTTGKSILVWGGRADVSTLLDDGAEGAL
jgi:hypothetical protein